MHADQNIVTCGQPSEGTLEIVHKANRVVQKTVCRVTCRHEAGAASTVGPLEVVPWATEDSHQC